MKVRYLSTLAATAGVLAGGQAFAQEPARLPASTTPVMANQKLADTVASRLAASGVTGTAELTVVAKEGVVTITGAVKDAAQRQQIVREIQLTAGVTKIRDGMSVPATVIPAQGTELPAIPPTGRPTPAFGPVAAQPVAAIPPTMVYGGPVIEPAPLGAAGCGPAGCGVADGAAPPLPPYAWPTYAPYNNVSRVGYPQAYPYNAFPFIGPYYPFPKVPLGWRKVVLEWEDGFWWIGKVQAPQDYWRVRFW